jgi:hypothetical protein
MQFIPDDLHPKMYWFGEGNCKVGNNYQIPDRQAAVRKWVAPHGGVVRIEGRAAVSQAGAEGVLASIRQNDAMLWPERLITQEQPSAHDLTVTVKQGDAICFISVKKNADSKNASPDAHKVTWDPVITYTASVPAVWKPNAPSSKNLALGKYARSKTLLSTYRPFDAVDGNPDTAYTIPADDKISLGDDWFSVDLDRTFMIDRYVVVSKAADPASRLTTFTLQRSDDQFCWTDVDSVVGNASERIEREVPVFRARYVRLYLPKGKPFTINEFELYFTGGRSASPTSQ